MKVSVIIKPNSKHREGAVKADDGSLTILTKAQAIEGRANEAATMLLSKYYRVSKSRVKLVKGYTSKRKVFEIDI